MDAFGIGAALKGATNIYFQGARRTGRTTALLESLKDGDRVVCLNESAAHHLQSMARELGRTISVIVWLPGHGQRSILEYGTSQGRTVFDHTWVEALYMQRLEDTVAYIDKLQQAASGFGMAHVETRLAAREVAKWRL